MVDNRTEIRDNTKMKTTKIEEYLNNTVKNTHYFQSENCLVDTEFTRNWRETVSALETIMYSENTENKKWSKEDYLIWVKLWKALYAKLSYESRMTKTYRKPTYVESCTNFSREKSGYIATTNLWYFYQLRFLANELLGIRKTGKILAHEAYEFYHPKMELETA